ncbi:MAG: DAK2 domain-containing protein [Chloroflexota bacterium]
MASAETLVALFESISQNLQQDREHLNQLDGGDGDHGDNMAANFDLITRTLSQTVQRRGPNADVGAALRQAAQALNKQGQGATAPIYAQGLMEASQQLQGQQGFSMEMLLPLLQGLLQGTRQASGTDAGQGSMMDVIVPGALAYIQAKQGGASDLQAILTALLNLRRGANSTAGSAAGYGSAQGMDTTGRVDPGAASAASVLEGMFGGLLQSALQQGLGSSQPAAPAPQPAAPGQIDLGGLLGSLFGPGGAR